MTPLFKKLGIKEGFKVYVLNYREEYQGLFQQLPTGVQVTKRKPRAPVQIVHLFVQNYSELDRFYEKAKSSIAIDGMLWISWPKGNKNIDINRDIIRDYGLHHGLVDVKVASINDYWSALKFVYRLKDR